MTRNRDVTIESSLPVVSENGLITNLAVDFSGAPSVSLPANTVINGLGTLVDTSSVQTLTNKTLNAPTTIVGAVISGSTIGTSTINGVTLTTGGGTTTFLNANGTYSVPASGNLTGAITSVGNATSLGSFTSAQLAIALTDETGSGANVFATAPTITGATLTTTSVNGVTLSSTGSSSLFLNQAGGYASVAGSGTVTSVSVVTANGFAGTVATSTSTPAITLTTSITGILQGNGTAISAISSTGSGNVVLATSATLVTPALGTPTALVGTNISGTATNLTSGITNALASATTTVNVASATAPTSGQVLTATSGTAATWQTPSATAAKVIQTFSMETAGRYATTNIGGTVSFGTSGASLASTTTGGNLATLLVQQPTGSQNVFDGNPTATFAIGISTIAGATANGTGTWLSIGADSVSSANASTDKHIGFNLVSSSGTISVFGTQANGTTETRTSAIITGVAGGDSLELMAAVSGTTVTYYARKNGGTQSSASATGTVPTGAASTASGDNPMLSATVYTVGGANSVTVTLQTMSYQR